MGAAFVVILICAVVLYLFLKRKLTSAKQKKQCRSRLTYIAVIIFCLVLVRIWIEGFTHIFTMLSLVAAGLVVTNKESIMNIVGWLIINWRGLFSEGDLIQFQNQIGYVSTIKLFFFKLNEVDDMYHPRLTGRRIKIPNGLLISNPVIMYSPEFNLVKNQIIVKLSGDADLTKAVKVSQKIIDKIIDSKYGQYQKFNIKAQFEGAPMASVLPRVLAQVNSEKDTELEVKVIYYGLVSDSEQIDADFWTEFLVANRQKSLGLMIK